MGRKKDLTDKTFGILTALRRDPERKGYWICLCECGKEKSIRGKDLTYGSPRSCGCLIRVDLKGERFGRLSVIQRDPERKGYWICLCSCSNLKSIRGSNLQDGLTKSCGCLKKQRATETHKKYKNNRGSQCPEYRAWNNMKLRCNNSNSFAFPNYGGRGIKVCDRWMESFEHFLEDMGRKPGKGFSIDRIDNEGDYEPRNCKWGTWEDQANNRRNNVMITDPENNEILSVSQFCRKYDYDRKSFQYYYREINLPLEQVIEKLENSSK